MGKSIYDQFHEAALEYPHNLAVRFERKTWSYHQLSHEIDRCARKLLAFGHQRKRTDRGQHAQLPRGRLSFLCHQQDRGHLLQHPSFDPTANDAKFDPALRLPVSHLSHLSPPAAIAKSSITISAFFPSILISTLTPLSTSP
jgi:hypothetical protein